MSKTLKIICKWKTGFNSSTKSEYLFQLENLAYIWAHQIFFNCPLIEVSDWPLDEGGPGHTILKLKKIAAQEGDPNVLSFLDTIEAGKQPDWTIDNAPTQGTKKTEHLCTCSLDDLMIYGCQCGGK